MKTLILLVLLCFCISAYAQVDDIFIGNFLTFDPYLLSADHIKDSLPGLENRRLFVWLFYNVAYDTLLRREYSDSSDLEYVYSLVFTTKDSLVKEGVVLFPGSPVYLVCNGSVYSTEIREFVYYVSLWGKANIYASCSIPQEIHNLHQTADFDVLCSTSRSIKVFYDEFEMQEDVDEFTEVGDYRFWSHIEDTGEKGHYLETVYNSFIRVRIDKKTVYDTGRQGVPLFFKIGDFNGNGKVDMYVEHHPWHQYFWIIEFDGESYYQKEYVIESME